MLFIVGTKSYNLKNGQIENFSCPLCSQHTTLDYSLYKSYAHLTLIPLFPVDKQIDFACSSCSELLELSQLPEDIKSKIELIKNAKTTKTPYWMYSGIVILAGFAIFGIYSFFEINGKTELYLKNPRQGDVVNQKLSTGYYTTMRIDKVTKDSVYGTSNDYNADLPYETDDIDKEENYTNAAVQYSRKDLVRLYDKGEINSIKRKQFTE
jgi:hypothetical protein